MKFTKILALVLVLLMTVAAFAACGDPAETKPSDTSGNSSNPLDTAPVDDTGCKHSNKKTGNDKDATCTEPGYIEYECKKCGFLSYKPVEPIAHTYSEFKSVDGKYTKSVCMVCKQAVVTDEAGNTVADASAINFPLFSGTFDGLETLDDAAKVFDGFSLARKYANIIKNDPNGEIYLNIPSGDARNNPNGYLELQDTNAQLVGKAFTLTFYARYDEAPTAKTALLTWTVGGNAQVILSADKGGKYMDASGSAVAQASTKGWDKFVVEFTASGSYTVTLNGNQIASGSVATSGSTSAIRFFDDKNQFEAYLDEVIVYTK